jgi:hypothetical protein
VPLLVRVNSGAVSQYATAPLLFRAMKNEREDDRRAKVTPETKAESARLRRKWDERPEPRLSQTVFGEIYGIGGQSAVGQFLRGDIPLSLKAAKGFAAGLGCSLPEISERLAAEAASMAGLLPTDSLPADVIELAREIHQLPPRDRKRVLGMCREIVELARASRRRDKPGSQSGDGID